MLYLVKFNYTNITSTLNYTYVLISLFSIFTIYVDHDKDDDDFSKMTLDDVTDEHGKSKRIRTSFNQPQLRAMKTYFALNHNPDSKDLKQLSLKTGLNKRVLQVWFQNARAKYRRSIQQVDKML